MRSDASGNGWEFESRKVMQLLCEDRRLNISPYYLRPGTPYGGSCLPKDVNALCHFSRDLGIPVPIMENLPGEQ